jgi:hypothetical protein
MYTRKSINRHLKMGEASDEKRNSRRFRQNLAVFFSRSLTKHAAGSFEQRGNTEMAWGKG